MLAQNFMTAASLSIPEPHRQALMKTLVLLETGKLTHTDYGDIVSITSGESSPFSGHFNMGRWRAAHRCGTVCCIGGTAEIVGGVSFADIEPAGLEELFFGHSAEVCLAYITPAQAARALRSYLTTGDANWKAALKIEEA